MPNFINKIFGHFRKNKSKNLNHRSESNNSGEPASENIIPTQINDIKQLSGYNKQSQQEDIIKSLNPQSVLIKNGSKISSVINNYQNKKTQKILPLKYKKIRTIDSFNNLKNFIISDNNKNEETQKLTIDEKQDRNVEKVKFKRCNEITVMQNICNFKYTRPESQVVNNNSNNNNDRTPLRPGRNNNRNKSKVIITVQKSESDDQNKEEYLEYEVANMNDDDDDNDYKNQETVINDDTSDDNDNNNYKQKTQYQETNPFYRCQKKDSQVICVINYLDSHSSNEINRINHSYKIQSPITSLTSTMSTSSSSTLSSTSSLCSFYYSSNTSRRDQNSSFKCNPFYKK